MARRGDLFTVTSVDVTHALDFISNVSGKKSGSESSRCDSPKQTKLTGDGCALITSPETEEPGIVEIKSEYKLCEVDCNAGKKVQMVSTAALPPRKNKVSSGKDLADGVSQQGRTSRGSVPDGVFQQGRTSRGSVPTAAAQKFSYVRSAKQFRITKIDANNTESKVGRSPTKKLYDPNACMRNRHPAVDVAANFLDSDDGPEELLAAKAAVNTSHANSSLFWRQIEPLFGFVPEADLIFLKQQRQKKLLSELETESVEHLQEQFVPPANCHKTISLWQRLTAALIMEEDEDYCARTEENSTDINGNPLGMDEELENCSLSQRLTGKSHATAVTTSNENQRGDVWRSIDRLGESEQDYPLFDGLPAASARIPDMLCLDEYVNMSIDEKLLLEVQSIGIFLEQSETQQTNGDEIIQEMRNLEEKYHAQVLKKGFLIDELLKSASKSNELQQKYWEQSALDKLITMAYVKYMAQGRQSFCGKSSSSKRSREAVLKFMRRALESCQKYEATGISCFSEPPFRDIFRMRSTLLVEAQSVGGKDHGLHQSVSMSPGASPLSAQFDQNVDKHDAYYADPLLSANLASTGKRNEERKRKCSSHNISRTKAGCSDSSIVEGERKSKAAKQNGTPISAKELNSSVPKISVCFNIKDEKSMEVNDSDDTIDLSNLELLEMDVDLGGQGQDISSWLDAVDDDGLADVDISGLEIPMDDLSDLDFLF